MKELAIEQYVNSWRKTISMGQEYRWADVKTRLSDSIYLPNARSLSELYRAWDAPNLSKWGETTIERSTDHRDENRSDQGICGDLQYIFVSQRGYVWRARNGLDRSALFDIEKPERELKLADLEWIWKGWPGSYDHIGAATLWDGGVWLPIESKNKLLPALLVRVDEELAAVGKQWQLFFVNPITGKREEQTQCGWCAFNPVDGLVYTSIEAWRIQGVDKELDKGLARNLILVYDVSRCISDDARHEIVDIKRTGEDGQESRPFAYLSDSDVCIPEFVGFFPLGEFDEFAERSGYQDINMGYFYDIHFKMVDTDRAQPFQVCGGAFSSDGQLWLSVGNWTCRDEIDVLGLYDWEWKEGPFFGHICLASVFDGKIIDWRPAGLYFAGRALSGDDYGFYEPEGLMLLKRGSAQNKRWPEIVYMLLYNSRTAECTWYLSCHTRKFWQRRLIVVSPPEYPKWG
jgi:hypothetical protein